MSEAGFLLLKYSGPKVGFRIVHSVSEAFGLLDLDDFLTEAEAFLGEADERFGFFWPGAIVLVTLVECNGSAFLILVLLLLVVSDVLGETRTGFVDSGREVDRLLDMRMDGLLREEVGLRREKALV